MDSTLGDVEANLAQAAEVIARAKDDRSDLIVFPELYLSGYSVGTVGTGLPLKQPFFAA